MPASLPSFTVLSDDGDTVAIVSVVKHSDGDYWVDTEINFPCMGASLARELGGRLQELANWIDGNKILASEDPIEAFKAHCRAGMQQITGIAGTDAHLRDLDLILRDM